MIYLILMIGVISVYFYYMEKHWDDKIERRVVERRITSRGLRAPDKRRAANVNQFETEDAFRFIGREK